MTMPLDLFTETEGMALSEMLTTLRTLTSNVRALTAQSKLSNGPYL